METNPLNIDSDQFFVTPHIISGETCYLVCPKRVGLTWNQSNKIFRSSLWNSKWQLISAGFPKFTNWQENIENFPIPNSLLGCEAVSKIDGSLLIVSRYRGETIIRTRGTVSARQLETGKEISYLESKYPKAFSFTSDSGMEMFSDDVSYLFEWTGGQKIVINYGDEPEITLISIINHKDYSFWKQKDLDWKASQMGVKRPEYFNFGSISEMVENVKKMEGMEGVVLYSENGQVLHKIKSNKYLLLHSLKSELSSFQKVLDFWFELKKPEGKTFYEHIESQFDFEIAELAKENIQKIININSEVQKELEVLKQEILPLQGLSRRDAAMVILNKHKELSGPAFSFLDGKEIPDKTLEKLILAKT